MKHLVRDVMTKQVVVVRDGASFKELVSLMDEHGVTALPVVGDDARLVGIVSEADLLVKEGYGPAGSAPRIRGRRARAKAGGMVAADVMTTPVVTVGPDASLSEAARLLHARGIKRMPVTGHDGRVLGIVSRADLLRVFLRPDADIQHEVLHDVIRRTLWIEPTTIAVRVEDGVVTLSGVIEQRSLVPILVEMVGDVEGVVSVIDHLGYCNDDSHVKVPTDAWTVFAPGAHARA